jgi:hypothetical protein
VPYRHCRSQSSLCVVKFLAAILDYSSTAPAYHDLQVPFHFQNNQSPHHIRPKASWVLVYPGVESSSFTGVWAGRCVIAHLDDCWGLFRRFLASSPRAWHRRICRAGEVMIGCSCFWIECMPHGRIHSCKRTFDLRVF